MEAILGWMVDKYSRYIFSLLLIIIITSKGMGQGGGICPPNLDFEAGDFTNWQCRTGTVSVAGGVNTINWTGNAPVPGRHTIITPLTSMPDPYGFFPTMCPNGSNYSVRLGNAGTGSQAEGLTYTIPIPNTVTSFSILYYYAVVLQDPSHLAAEQPRFRARIIDQTTGNPLPCVTFDFTASASLPGFRRSTVDPTVWYKDWTPISLNLSAYIGRTIQIEFITSDCTRSGHFGYAYMDVSSNCSGIIQGSTLCPGANSTTLTAPWGFQGYRWYSDMTFSSIIGSNQTLTLSPAPMVGSVFPVIVDPYPGFGCVDTLYATITISPNPVADAGPDTIVCKGKQVQIGSPPQPGLSYSWTPVAEVSNPNISNPLAQPLTPDPTEYVVLTTDIITGCFSRDTAIVSISTVDTALAYAGNEHICNGDPGPVLSINPGSINIQWHELSSGPIPGANNSSYQPFTTGDYWAEFEQNGCKDTTRTVTLTAHPLPVPSFTFRDTACVKVSTVTFTNTSATPDGSNVNYVWTFSDGPVQTTTDAVRTFLSTGVYTVQLKATTEWGCTKTGPEETIHILPGGKANFNWDSICVGKPVHFRNLSNENGSPKSYYSWYFNNGSPPVNVKDPPAIIYNNPPGQLDVTLKMTTLGCEMDTQVVVRTVQVNKNAPGISYPSLTVPQGSTQWIHARDTVGTEYYWRPAIQLSSYRTRYTEFTAAANDVTYYIDITDKHTCVTTDTMQMLVLKKPGFYLPTAFTPNRDGLNDLVRPYLVGMNGLKSFSIFNRWGNRLFFSQTYGEGWNGKFKGEDQAAGVYIWVLEYYDANNRVRSEKGMLTLIR